MAAAEDCGSYYRIPPDLRDLNYGKFFEEGEGRITASTDYNSHNTERLDVKKMQAMLLRLAFITEHLAGRRVPPEA
jgi:UDP-glucose 4-epimerase